MLGFVSIVIAVPLAVTYAKTGLVPRLPTAVLSTGLMILAVLSFFSGMILDTVVRGRRELRRLAYLALRPRNKRCHSIRLERCPVRTAFF